VRVDAICCPLHVHRRLHDGVRARAMRASPRLCFSPPRVPQARFMELLRLRYSSPLLRLPRAEHILRQLSFLNTGAQQARASITLYLPYTRSVL